MISVVEVRHSGAVKSYHSYDTNQWAGCDARRLIRQAYEKNLFLEDIDHDLKTMNIRPVSIEAIDLILDK